MNQMKALGSSECALLLQEMGVVPTDVDKITSKLFPPSPGVRPVPFAQWDHQRCQQWLSSLHETHGITLQLGEAAKRRRRHVSVSPQHP